MATQEQIDTWKAENPEQELPSDMVLDVEETPEELKDRLKNAKAENDRKTAEIQRLREEASRPAQRHTPDPQDPSTWKDHELKAVLNDPNWAHMKDAALEEIESRRFKRVLAQRDEETLRLNSERELQEKYPAVLDPTHPLAVRTNQILHDMRLGNSPAGRLAAAKLAHNEIEAKKAEDAGRRKERERQVDVNANFGGGSRPAPVVKDKVKLEELKKRAMAGDPQARSEWFAHKGLL